MLRPQDARVGGLAGPSAFCLSAFARPACLPQVLDRPDTGGASGAADDAKMPTSHTCSLTLHLRPYSSREAMRERLLKAAHFCGTIDTDTDAAPAQAPPDTGAADGVAAVAEEGEQERSAARGGGGWGGGGALGGAGGGGGGRRRLLSSLAGNQVR